jgi:two-component system, cell cycle response regulator
MTFSVRLPWHVLCFLKVVRKLTEQTGASGEEGRAMRILIADDDAISRKLLRASLVKFGYEVIVCSDGNQAWQILQKEKAPNLVLLDWVMPGMDGVEVCRQVRGMGRHSYVYIILLTGKGAKEDVVEGLEAGADDYLIKPFDPSELQVRLRAGARIVQLQEELLSALDASRFAASHDPLTQLWNRAAIMDIAGKERVRAMREGTTVCVVMADIDYFKHVNDQYGHLAGDAVLREVAQRISNSVRPYDSVGRYGGEEFIVCLPECQLGEAEQIAERLRVAIGGNPISSAEGIFHVTISLGVASGELGTDRSVESIIHASDEALYRAKNLGRNRVESSEAAPSAKSSLLHMDKQRQENSACLTTMEACV